jgi:hypothetical protein
MRGGHNRWTVIRWTESTKTRSVGTSTAKWRAERSGTRCCPRGSYWSSWRGRHSGRTPSSTETKWNISKVICVYCQKKNIFTNIISIFYYKRFSDLALASKLGRSISWSDSNSLLKLEISVLYILLYSWRGYQKIKPKQ